MSLCTVDRALIRIQEATKNSPIAVFKDYVLETGTGHKKPALNACFANTVYAQMRMNSSKDRLIGVFDSSSKGVQKQLTVALYG